MTYTRTITTVNSHITGIDPPKPEADLHNWLSQVANDHSLTYLLAHADDGVIWGVVDSANLRLSCDDYPQRTLTLRWATLQQCRLFGADGEVLLWRDDDMWSARLIRDGAGNAVDIIDECYLLWGSRTAIPVPTGSPFLWLAEGTQGIAHAPPIDRAPPIKRRSAHECARLKVRHYIRPDEVGVLRIIGSRLVAVISPRENN